MARMVTITALVLEVNEVPNKEGKVYPKLILFEQGQRYPGVVPVSLQPDQVAEAKTLVGKSGSVNAEISEYQGRVNYYYRGVGK